ncbi:AcrR family transcriptional regulator [Prauserella sediminis]|uniref:AcrR family transcriptional regulator n=1 Tax=Prauserella sediminis TaxID=577680 RepID=A0A839XYH9_9PSEU|nr:TetR/AcrR family transcriptional regulator [Prauserella sediminis]MBB3665483.1 AcrR family transcriptional regulator [Prauserella sediminis]
MSGSTAGTPRRAGRPTRAEASELTRSLRSAALDVFLDNGFAGTTMEAVARTAGITKRTLYGRYPDKHALFLDVVQWAMTEYKWADPVPVGDTDDIALALTDIARAAVARALDPDLVRLNRILLLEAERLPELTRTAQSRSWSPRMKAVMTVLQRHQDRGEVQLDDIEVAAEQFLALVTGGPARLAIYGLHQTVEEHERFLRNAVSIFLKGALTR